MRLRARPRRNSNDNNNNLFVRLAPSTVARLVDVAVAQGAAHQPWAAGAWSIADTTAATRRSSSSSSCRSGIEFLPLVITVANQQPEQEQQQPAVGEDVDDATHQHQKVIYASYNGSDLVSSNGKQQQQQQQDILSIYSCNQRGS